MKNWMLSLLLVWPFLLPAQEVGSLKWDELDTYIEQSRQMWHIPGLAIAVVKDGKIVHAKGFGVRSVDTQKKVTEESLFAIASNSKAFTVAALSKLVDEGKISWNDPIRKHLPWFELYNEYVSNNITIRDALCHNSGLNTFSGDLLWYETNYTARQVLERAKFLKPTFDFRAGYGYSNIMYTAAGEVIPAVTGKSWTEYVEEELLQELQMKNTKTSVKDFTKNDNLAMPHFVDTNGKAEVMDYLPWDNAPAAAAINSSVKEMANWMIMQLNNGEYNGKQIVSKKQIAFSRKMHNPQAVGGSLRGKANFKGYGLGWDMYDYYGKKIINHGGGSDGMISKVMLMPEDGFGFVILTNSINWLPSALSYRILDMYLGKKTQDYAKLYYDYKVQQDARKAKKYENEKAARNKESKPTHTLSDFVGTYSGDLYGDATVSLKDGKLVVDLLPAPDLIGDLTHWEFNTFEIELRHTPLLPKGKVNFIIGVDGKVEEMRVRIPNPDFWFYELEFKRKRPDTSVQH